MDGSSNDLQVPGTPGTFGLAGKAGRPVFLGVEMGGGIRKEKKKLEVKEEKKWKK